MVKSGSIAAAAASLLMSFPAANGMYTKSSPVLQVDAKTYDGLINRSNHTAIIEFYAPWCGHCQNLKPAYEKAAKSLSGLAKVAAVDCDEESNKPLCGSMGVQGFPTLKIVRPGKKPGKPTVEDYQGARSAKAIVDYVIDKIPNHVKRLKDADYAAWVAEADRPKAILFTEKGTVSALLKSLAIEFLSALDIAQIRNKETEATEAFGVESFPTLVLFPGEGKEPITYKGELKKEPMVKFLSQAASPNPDPPVKEKKPKATKSDKSKDASASSKVAEASASQKAEQGKGEPGEQDAQPHKPEARPSTPDTATPILSLQDGLSLQQKCLNDKASTCVLALLPHEDVPSAKTLGAVMSLSQVHHKHEMGKRNLFPFYQLPDSNTQAAALRTKLRLSANDVEIIAVNGKRDWWRHYPSTSDFKLQQVEDWVDAIRMGDLKKFDIPTGLLADAASLPSEPVKLETDEKIPDSAWKSAEETEELKQMKEGLMQQMPEGMDFEIEEIDDDEYERIMKQGEKAEDMKVEDHDEL